MAISKTTSAKKLALVDTKPGVPKLQAFIFGSIIASASVLGAILFVAYQQYLHNPTFHMFIQSKGIFL